MLVFLSYQHEDRHIAAEAAHFFNALAIETFMAHENIGVSFLWQAEILNRLRVADIFVAILTERYNASAYCLQESGIAVHRQNEMTIMPLRVNNLLPPPGFLSHFQAKQFEPGSNNDPVMFAGLAARDAPYAIDLLINRLAAVDSWAQAGTQFGLIRPLLGQASVGQKVEILQLAAVNNQIAGSHAIRADLLGLLDDHRQALTAEEQQTLDFYFGT